MKKNISIFYIIGPVKKNYPRHNILIDGLRKNNVQITAFYVSGAKNIFGKYLQILRFFRKTPKNFDYIFVGEFAHQLVLIGKYLAKRCQAKLIFDPFVSYYETMVEDRMLVKKYSLKAMYYYLLDKLSMAQADLILADTKAHRKYYHAKIGLKQDKIKTVYLGAPPEFLKTKPTKTKSKNFTVLFYGTFIPLHGIENIVLAAERLKNRQDIYFELIGAGQEKRKIEQLIRLKNLTNIKLFGSVTSAALIKRLQKAAICLGIFGTTCKTKNVIPNKIYQCTFLQKPVITLKTPALAEFKDNNNVFTVSEKNIPKNLAETILKIMANYQKIINNTNQRFNKYYLPQVIAKKLLEDIHG